MTRTLDDAQLATAVQTSHYQQPRWRPGKSHPASRHACPCSTCAATFTTFGELDPIETLPWLAGRR